MHLDAIAFEPSTSYLAIGKRSMGGGATIASQIRLATDQSGRIREYSDGTPFSQVDMANIWDYRGIANAKTGVIWDLRPHTAAADGDVGLAKRALAEGADTSLRMKQGATALHWAAAKGREEIARLLLQHGADVNTTDELGWTPLFLAAQNGFDSMVKLFLQHGAKTKGVVCGKHVSIATENNRNEDVSAVAESGNCDAAGSALGASADATHSGGDRPEELGDASNEEEEQPAGVSLLLDPLAQVRGEAGVGVRIDGVTYSFTSREARRMLAHLTEQFGDDGQPRSSKLHILTKDGQRTIQRPDAEHIMAALESLLQSGVLELFER